MSQECKMGAIKFFPGRLPHFLVVNFPTLALIKAREENTGKNWRLNITVVISDI